MRKGIMAAAIVDIFILLLISVLNIALIGNYGAVWFFVIILADVLLLIGAMQSNTGLMMAWMVLGMIHIVFMFIGWIAWPVIYAVSLAVKCLDTGSGDWQTYQNKCTTNDAKMIGMVFWISMIFTVVMPCYYIYLWVVVKSHRENLVKENMVLPMHAPAVATVDEYGQKVDYGTYN